jgi:hypothetical protein
LRISAQQRLKCRAWFRPMSASLAFERQNVSDEPQTANKGKSPWIIEHRRGLKRDFNFSRVAPILRLCFLSLFSRVSRMSRQKPTPFFCVSCKRERIVSKMSRVFLVILIEHSAEFKSK